MELLHVTDCTAVRAAERKIEQVLYFVGCTRSQQGRLLFILTVHVCGRDGSVAMQRVNST